MNLKKNKDKNLTKNIFFENDDKMKKTIYVLASNESEFNHIFRNSNYKYIENFDSIKGIYVKKLYICPFYKHNKWWKLIIEDCKYCNSEIYYRPREFEEE